MIRTVITILLILTVILYFRKADRTNDKDDGFLWKIFFWPVAIIAFLLIVIVWLVPPVVIPEITF